MKKLACLFISSFLLTAAVIAQSYTPSAANLEARKLFQDNKFGMFIHWGASSVLGHGEWVMNQRNIGVKEYTKLIHVFNPQSFDAKKWVSAAKAAGMKYITFITRHHDGFSNWDTKQSEWKITNTPYGKDALKQLADECHAQGMKLACYYSLLDWYRSDYQYETGRTGKGTGRTAKSDWNHYINFMKAQLTELLTNYGEISGIWFDGHWDQTAPEGAEDRTSRVDWHYKEIYELIHKLQPQCLVGNNHHMAPFDGEDFQMFEKDLPGQNTSGLNFQEGSKEMPVETCETMNDSWGFNITDNNYKSTKTLVQYLVKAAGHNANFLLNVGPMPDGNIQQEFVDTLALMGKWLQKNGETIYGTRGNLIPAKPWGVLTAKNKTVYMHILNRPENPAFVFVPELKEKISKAVLFGTSQTVKIKQQAEGTFVYLDGIAMDDVDTIIQLELK